MHVLQEELIALQPQLEDSTRQTEAAMEVIARETAEADKVKKVRLNIPAGHCAAIALIVNIIRHGACMSPSRLHPVTNTVLLVITSSLRFAAP
jgi:hypothetical protein